MSNEPYLAPALLIDNLKSSRSFPEARNGTDHCGMTRSKRNARKGILPALGASAFHLHMLACNRSSRLGV